MVRWRPIEDATFAAIEEFDSMVNDPEFPTDYDGHVRVWLRETPSADVAARLHFPGVEYEAMNPPPDATPEEWARSLNTFWALRAAMRSVGLIEPLR